MLGIALVIEIFTGAGLRLDRIGIAAALLAAFAFSFYNIAAHDVLARNDRWKILLWTVLIASAFWAIVNPPWRVIAAGYSREQWIFLAIFSLVSMLSPFSFYFAGLQHLEPTQAVVVSCLEPVFSILIAALALREHVGPIQILGVVFVLLAIVVIQLRERGEPEAVIEPIE
jgi:drug/metabolite transporter (DMT)-like permease